MVHEMLTAGYSIAEMAGGWGNPVMQNEGLFIALEGVYVPPFFLSREIQFPIEDVLTCLFHYRMVLYPAMLLSIFSPGIFFPQMSKLRSDYEKETAALNEQSSSGSLREGDSGVQTGKAQ